MNTQERFEAVKKQIKHDYSLLNFETFNFSEFSKARFELNENLRPVFVIAFENKPFFSTERYETTDSFFFFFWNRIKHAAKLACEVMGEIELFNRVEAVMKKDGFSLFYDLQPQKAEELIDDYNLLLDYVFNAAPDFAKAVGKTIKLFSNNEFILPIAANRAQSCLVQYNPIKHEDVLELIPAEVQKHFRYGPHNIHEMRLRFGNMASGFKPAFQLIVENGQTGYLALGFHAALSFSNGFIYHVAGKNRTRHIVEDKIDGIMDDISEVFSKQDALAFWNDCFGFMPLEEIKSRFVEIIEYEVGKAGNDKLIEKLTHLFKEFNRIYADLSQSYLDGKLSQLDLINQLFHQMTSHRHHTGYKTITDKVFTKLLDAIYKERKSD